MYIEFKRENRLAVACLEKNSEFRWLIIKISEINGTNFFQNIAYFKTSRSCSNWCASPTMYTVPHDFYTLNFRSQKEFPI